MDLSTSKIREKDRLETLSELNHYQQLQIRDLEVLLEEERKKCEDKSKECKDMEEKLESLFRVGVFRDGRRRSVTNSSILRHQRHLNSSSTSSSSTLLNSSVLSTSLSGFDERMTTNGAAALIRSLRQDNQRLQDELATCENELENSKKRELEYQKTLSSFEAEMAGVSGNTDTLFKKLIGLRMQSNGGTDASKNNRIGVNLEGVLGINDMSKENIEKLLTTFGLQAIEMRNELEKLNADLKIAQSDFKMMQLDLEKTSELLRLEKEKNVFFEEHLSNSLLQASTAVRKFEIADEENESLVVSLNSSVSEGKETLALLVKCEDEKKTLQKRILEMEPVIACLSKEKEQWTGERTELMSEIRRLRPIERATIQVAEDLTKVNGYKNTVGTSRYNYHAMWVELASIRELSPQLSNSISILFQDYKSLLMDNEKLNLTVEQLKEESIVAGNIRDEEIAKMSDALAETSTQARRMEHELRVVENSKVYESKEILEQVLDTIAAHDKMFNRLDLSNLEGVPKIISGLYRDIMEQKQLISEMREDNEVLRQEKFSLKRETDSTIYNLVDTNRTNEVKIAEVLKREEALNIQVAQWEAELEGASDLADKQNNLIGSLQAKVEKLLRELKVRDSIISSLKELNEAQTFAQEQQQQQQQQIQLLGSSPLLFSPNSSSFSPSPSRSAVGFGETMTLSSPTIKSQLATPRSASPSMHYRRNRSMSPRREDVINTTSATKAQERLKLLQFELSAMKE